MTNLTEYLNRLREVEGKATSGPWKYDVTCRPQGRATQAVTSGKNEGEK